MYATLDDIRGEGVLPTEADDPRVLATLEEASRAVDQACGWFFEPRELVLRLDGRGTPTLWLPAAPIRVDRVEVNGWSVSVSPETLVIVGAPASPGFDGPRITRPFGVFPRGQGNVLVAGLWGFTEPDGTRVGRVPRAIRRACILLTLRWLAPLTSDASTEARNRDRIIEERTRDQSYKLAEHEAQGVLTGDVEVDRMLAPFRRPPAMGAA
jgi:hypothetical protein